VKQVTAGGALSVGTISTQDLPATAVRTDQGNTYSAGIQDFTGAGATLPAKSGTTLPSTCRQGEVFFRTDAAAGQNLFFCTATNVWTQMSGGGLGDPGSNGLVKRTDANATAPATASDLAAPAYCVDSGSTDSYVCSVSPAVGGYTTGLRVTLRANTANTGSASLKMNGLGSVTIRKNQSQDLSDNDIKAGQVVELVYDGSIFQMPSPVSTTAALTAGSNITVNGTTVSWNRIEATTAGYWDDFLSGNGATYAGLMQWNRTSVIAGTNSGGELAESTVNPERHPGTYKWTAGSSSPAQGNGIWIASSSSTFPFRIRATQLEWTLQFVAYYASLANLRTRLGWVYYISAPGLAPSTGIWIRYDTNASFGDGTRNGGNGTWVAEVCNSSVCTALDFGVAPTTAWHTFTIQRVVSGVGGNPTIYFAVDGTTKTFCASGCDAVATNVPATTTTLSPALQLVTDTNASKTVEVDAIGLQITGLTRN
jgi:hypothetical protein